MKVTGIGSNSASGRQYIPQVQFASISKKPGGQTSMVVMGQQNSVTTSAISGKVEFKATASEGFVLDGYYLGTFEFDSLTGHPGIRY